MAITVWNPTSIATPMVFLTGRVDPDLRLSTWSIETPQNMDLEKSIWVNYNDLTILPNWESWLIREIIPKWPNYSGEWNIAIIYPDQRIMLHILGKQSMNSHWEHDFQWMD